MSNLTEEFTISLTADEITGLRAALKTEQDALVALEAARKTYDDLLSRQATAAPGEYASKAAQMAAVAAAESVAEETHLRVAVAHAAAGEAHHAIEEIVVAIMARAGLAGMTTGGQRQDLDRGVLVVLPAS